MMDNDYLARCHPQSMGTGKEIRLTGYLQDNEQSRASLLLLE
jgi:hypothetical protein